MIPLVGIVELQKWKSGPVKEAVIFTQTGMLVTGMVKERRTLERFSSLLSEEHLIFLCAEIAVINKGCLSLIHQDN